MYLVSLVGDGCLFIAIALAATTGGSALAWGISFGIAHAFFATIGVAVAVELADKSEVLGSLVAFGGSLVLLRHFFHHRLHHMPGGDCSCEHHHHQSVRFSTIALTSFALSFHAIGTGAVLRGLFDSPSYPLLLSTVLIGALVTGLAVFFLVFLGESERHVITRIMDKTPGVSATILSGISAMTFVHFLTHASLLPEYVESVLLVCGGVASLAVGYIVHERNLGARLVQISPPKV